MARLPKGNVTFLCIALQAASEPHLALVRKAIDMQSGQIFKASDASVYAVFQATLPAVQAALSAQRHIRGAARQETSQQPAIAIHRGKAEEHGGMYVGPVFNRALSLLDAGHPGQVLLSAAAVESLANLLPAELELRDLGAYRLKDLVRTEHLYQVEAPGLPTEHPPLNTLDSRPHNLPFQPSPLIGREREVREVRDLLSQPAIRHVTLQGASGTGKTRLALQIAVEQIDDFDDGAYFVSLAPVQDPGLVIAVIGQVLGIKEQSGERLVETIAKALRDARMLLVLDNFEQVAKAASVVQELLEGTNNLKIIVTSQQDLAIATEHVFPVPPLAMPESSAHMSLDELSRVPAVALFIERAREAQPSFNFNQAIAPAVAELCSRLEGLPLAIELVAAQSKRYLPTDMLVLLHNHLAVTRARRRINTREEILRPVLDWICEVLGPSITALFSRLGVFAGGCTLDSASAICNPDDELHLDVSEALGILLDNHLLLREELKEQRVRYIMLDAVHEYAGQRLQKRRELGRLQAQHAQFYTERTELADVEIRNGQQQKWLNRLEDTHHNLRAALNWTHANDPALLLRLCGGLTRFWYLHADYSEGRRWFETALAQEAAAAAPPSLIAKLHHNLGLLAYSQGDFAPALAHTQTGLSLRQSMGDQHGIVLALNNLGLIAMAHGQYDEARDYYERGLAASHDLPERGIQISLLGNLGLLAFYALDFEPATSYFNQGWQLAVAMNDPWAQGMTMYNLGLIAFVQERFEQAEELAGQSMALAREIGNEVIQGSLLLLLAEINLKRDAIGAARGQLEQGIALLQRHGSKGGLVESLEVWADVLEAERNPIPAATLLSASLAAYTVYGAALTPVGQLTRSRTEARIRQQLSESAFAEAWRIGHGLSLDEALAYAQANG